MRRTEPSARQLAALRRTDPESGLLKEAKLWKVTEIERERMYYLKSIVVVVELPKTRSFPASAMWLSVVTCFFWGKPHPIETLPSEIQNRMRQMARDLLYGVGCGDLRPFDISQLRGSASFTRPLNQDEYDYRKQLRRGALPWTKSAKIGRQQSER